MGKFLIVGPPGSGKTTLLKELHHRGYATTDADSAPGLAGWVDTITGYKVADWSREISTAPAGCRWGWGLTELHAIVDNPPGEPFFLGGNTAGIERFYPLFDKVFGLLVNEDTNIQRLTSPRDNPNNYGTKPEHIEETRASNRIFADQEQRRGTLLIDAEQPVTVVADMILELI